LAYCVRIAPIEVLRANHSQLFYIPVISGIMQTAVGTKRSLEEAIVRLDDDDACPDEEFALSEVSNEERYCNRRKQILERLDEQFRVGNIEETLST
jgi:hypothetical protein